MDGRTDGRSDGRTDGRTSPTRKNFGQTSDDSDVRAVMAVRQKVGVPSLGRSRMPQRSFEPFLLFAFDPVSDLAPFRGTNIFRPPFVFFITISNSIRQQTAPPGKKEWDCWEQGTTAPHDFPTI